MLILWFSLMLPSSLSKSHLHDASGAELVVQVTEALNADELMVGSHEPGPFDLTLDTVPGVWHNLNLSHVEWTLNAAWCSEGADSCDAFQGTPVSSVGRGMPGETVGGYWRVTHTAWIHKELNRIHRRTLVCVEYCVPVAECLNE